MDFILRTMCDLAALKTRQFQRHKAALRLERTRPGLCCLLTASGSDEAVRNSKGSIVNHFC